MKKIIMLLAVALFSFGSMNAQRQNQGGRPRMSVEQQVATLKKELNLTDEQTTKVTALYTEFQKQRTAATAENRDSMRVASQKLEKDVQALLTEEQKALYTKMQEQRKAARGGGKTGTKNK